uniref:Uncharacterized protein MANES_08G104900 n=1 Tax=Rhizophora mucronata TaxID=61149 RepID=A0A2P2KAX1_RHIMU
MLKKSLRARTSCAALVSFIRFMTFGASRTSLRLCLYPEVVCTKTILDLCSIIGLNCLLSASNNK